MAESGIREKINSLWIKDGNLPLPKYYYPLAIVGFILFVPWEGFAYTSLPFLRLLSWLALFLEFALLAGVFIVQSVHRRAKKLDLIFYLIILTCTIYCAFTLLNSGSIFQLAKKVVFILGPWLYLAVFSRYGFKPLFRAMFLGSLIVLFANFISMLVMYPFGSFRSDYGDTWLFGQRTFMRNFIFLSVFFCLLNDRFYNKKCSVTTAIVIIVSLITFILGDSMTSLAVYCLLLMVVFFVIMGLKFPNIFRLALVGSAVLDILLVHARQIALFSFVIVDIFKRNLTLSYRTQAWDIVIDKIAANPFFGTGFTNLEDSGIVVGYGRYLSNAHNEVLDLWYKGGLFGLLSFAALVLACCLPLLKKTTYWAAFVLGAFLGAFFIEGVVSEIWYPQFFFLLFFAAYLDKWAFQFEQNYETSKGKSNAC